MQFKDVNIVKNNQERVKFSIDKLRKSLNHSGATSKVINQILKIITSELYEGISTKEIYRRAYFLLKKEKGHFASKYKLKKAIYELGPSGFPFENFISAILAHSGYETSVGVILQGACVKHEIDILAHKDKKSIVVECKYHGQEGLNCNVKVPLYINSRYIDVASFWNKKPNTSLLDKGWVVTNTRFSKDAITYGKCVDLYLLSWNYPPKNSLKDRINRLGLYPITVSTLLSKREKDFLLSREIVLCRQLIGDTFFLEHLKISPARQKRILKEISLVCNP